jgi:hypothetical protein
MGLLSRVEQGGERDAGLVVEPQRQVSAGLPPTSGEHRHHALVAAQAVGQRALADLGRAVEVFLDRAGWASFRHYRMSPGRHQGVVNGVNEYASDFRLSTSSCHLRGNT